MLVWFKTTKNVYICFLVECENCRGITFEQVPTSPINKPMPLCGFCSSWTTDKLWVVPVSAATAPGLVGLSTVLLLQLTDSRVITGLSLVITYITASARGCPHPCTVRPNHTEAAAAFSKNITLLIVNKNGWWRQTGLGLPWMVFGAVIVQLHAVWSGKWLCTRHYLQLIPLCQWVVWSPCRQRGSDVCLLLEGGGRGHWWVWAALWS